MSARDLIRLKKNPDDVLSMPVLADPETGEMHYLPDAPTALLARVLGMVQAEIDANLEYLYEAKRMLGREAIARMDKQGNWTMKYPGVQIVAPSPTAGTEEWDAEELERILAELVEEGVLEREAKLRAVEPHFSLRVDKRGVAQLLKIPAVRDRIAPARRWATPPRKASVRVNPRELR
jgi:hypothetical protein